MKYIKTVVYYLNYRNDNILQKHINEFESLKTGIFCIFAKKQKKNMFFKKTIMNNGNHIIFIAYTRRLIILYYNVFCSGKGTKYFLFLKLGMEWFRM